MFPSHETVIWPVRTLVDSTVVRTLVDQRFHDFATNPPANTIATILLEQIHLLLWRRENINI